MVTLYTMSIEGGEVLDGCEVFILILLVEIGSEIQNRVM